MELLTNSSTVNATMNDSTVALHCEMRAFIRPDSSLIWEGPGGQRITDGTEKYEITFSDGSPDSAANGSDLLVPSRMSTLTIINPEPSDAGTYTCTVTNQTTAAVVINLQVNGSNKNSMVQNITESSSNRAHQMTVIILCSVLAILILTVLLIIAGAEVCCHVHARKRRKSNSHTRSHSVYYNIIALLGLKRRIHHQSNENTITCQDNDYDLRVDVVNKDSVFFNPIRDDLSVTEMNVDRGVTVVSNVNGLTIDGASAAVADTNKLNMQENEAYGAAIDGIAIDTMERNVAYDTVIFQGDSAKDPILLVDCSMNRGM